MSIIPKLGQGTWYMGESSYLVDDEVYCLQEGIKKGMTLIDTAEMYAHGGAEIVAGKAIQPFHREDIFLVSKVLPHNAGEEHIFQRCDSSLDRLHTDYLDLYLLHWKGSVPLRETVDCMNELVKKGKIKNWGVSNFDTDDMRDLWDIPGGANCAANQVLYHLGSRGIEYNLLPWLREHGVPAMAYCPMAQAGSLRTGLTESKVLRKLARSKGISVMQLILAFVLAQENVSAIPKASTIQHVYQNAEAIGISLTLDELDILDDEFPAPDKKTFLDIV